jgi:hypothetical protein
LEGLRDRVCTKNCDLTTATATRPIVSRAVSVNALRTRAESLSQSAELLLALALDATEEQAKAREPDVPYSPRRISTRAG